MAAPMPVQPGGMEMRNIRLSLTLVSVFAVLLAIAYLISYLNHDYPPPPAEWQVWIQTWGKAWMEPFIPIPLATYRLFLAGAIIPGVLLAWTGMAAAGRLLSWVFRGKAGFPQYLNRVALNFFPFWILAAAVDFLYMGFVGPYILPALNMAYGPLARELVYAAPMITYVIPLSAGGVCIAITIHAMEGFAPWKAAIIGGVNTCLALAVITLLVR